MRREPVTDMTADQEDICGFCGEPGVDKIPHPVRWPGEAHPQSELVHSECEHAECGRAHRELMNRVVDNGVRDFLRCVS